MSTDSLDWDQAGLTDPGSRQCYRAYSSHTMATTNKEKGVRTRNNAMPVQVRRQAGEMRRIAQNKSASSFHW